MFWRNHKTPLRGLFFAFGVCFVLFNPLSQAAPVLDPLPPWAQRDLVQMVFLDLSKLQKDYDMSLDEAIEAQAWMRAFSANPEDQRNHADRLKNAIELVKTKTFLSQFKRPDLTSPGSFIAAVDLDEMLLRQWHRSAFDGNHDITGVAIDYDIFGNASGSHVKLAPGATEFVLALKALPGCKGVVVYSAKSYAVIVDLLKRWPANPEGTLMMSEIFDGVFAREHLVMGPGRHTPSKDLRVIDSTLKHVVLIDDNLKRVIQLENMRLTPRFDADRLLKNPGVYEALHKKTFQNILSEIRSAHRVSKKEGISFSQAYFPFTVEGVPLTQIFSPRAVRKMGLIHPEYHPDPKTGGRPKSHR